MTKEESGAETRQCLGALGWLRAQSGFRTAVIAFALTVVLGIGGTAAYAYWSQSATVVFTATTRSDLPANTTLIGAQPALQIRPGPLSTPTCATAKTHLAMINDTYTDIDFSWPAATRATSYEITIRSDSSYVYQQTQRVKAPTAKFVFERLQSEDNGNQKGANPPFYTKYTVRILPMNGDVPGDPVYRALEYAHWSVSCNGGVSAVAPLASPLGSAGEVQCATPVSGTGAGGYSDLTVNWARADKATSYSVRMVSPGGHGGEMTVTGTKASFRIMRPAPESNTAPYFATYVVRVQPMNGTVAGDPVYLQQYQFYSWGQRCG